MELQRQSVAAERAHGVNSPEAKDLAREAASERQAAIDGGWQSTGQGQRISGMDRRGSR
jgi:hypothetical protein